jgi:hypothetical protein
LKHPVLTLPVAAGECRQSRARTALSLKTVGINQGILLLNLLTSFILGDLT